MTALLAFLKLAWPYILAAGVGAYGAHELDQIPYDRQVTAFASYKAQVADADEKAQAAANQALQTEVSARFSAETHNAQVIHDLQSQADTSAADVLLARRLLSAAATPRSASPSGSVPQAHGQSGTAPASPADGRGGLTETLATAIDECRHNADQLDALIAEIKPQL